MTNDQIQQIALANGFKLKEQPDGSMALNPYVFDFARALLATHQPENERLRKDAERYQWLREEDNWSDDYDNWATLGEKTHKEFDDYIDAAMRRTN
jgi:hypothetical protein